MVVLRILLCLAAVVSLDNNGKTSLTEQNDVIKVMVNRGMYIAVTHFF